MAQNWTDEQKQVISLRDRNILVSAAAGSGKTAVLVERILKKLTDPEHPVDIDRLLIMTFTRAAAGEMKERIAAALENALYEDPDNEILQKQSALIHTAQINTIDGFCGYLLRNYFHLIDLDPGYRVADEGELMLVREEVMEALLEEKYAAAEPGFLEFAECYSSGKSDDGLREVIMQVYQSAMSHPEPKAWLKECLEYYQTESVEQLRATKTMQLLWEIVCGELEETQEIAMEAKALCQEAGGPYLYEPAIDSDLLLIQQAKALAKEKNYDGLGALLGNLSFARLSTKKAEDVEPDLKELVKAQREEVKEFLKGLGARLFPGTEEEILETVKSCRVSVEALLQLVLDFEEAFSAKKREKNLLDFTDMEHFALKILMHKPEDGAENTSRDDTEQMSQAAAELSEKYDEVMVDEYQDSNLIQEYLTRCVSGWINDRKNIFMVGDVKQSIYRFRLARPELFMEKYHTYPTTDAREQRIDLHKNFRSRAEVLDSVNFIFRQIMGEDLGGIAYDDAAALYPGAVFPEGGNPDFHKTEVLLVEKDGEELRGELDADSTQGNETAKELEALAIAHKIKSIVGKEEIVDSKTKEYRPIGFGDIVVLLRTASGWAEEFSQVFEAEGIPAYTASRTGYFSALEIVTVLNYLRVCDNPMQDIPLAGVLRSPMVGCTAEELAILRAENKKEFLYESVCRFLDEDAYAFFMDESRIHLKEKLRAFCDLLNRMRMLAEYTPIHELIVMVLDETGYGNLARALPGGEQRSANLNMLVEKAMEYEKTSYRGLFNFIRYIEKLQKYEVDFGEVNLSDAGSGAVQIMTIHKSKGLEFPVVFVAGMGKQFNFRDINARLLVHPDLGIGADAILPKERMIVSTVHKQILREEILRENLGEELRVLYVALTRAKEKLILTGTIDKLDKQVQRYASLMEQKEDLLPIGIRRKARNYWSFVLPALARHRAMNELYHSYGIWVTSPAAFWNASAPFAVQVVTAAELTETEVLHQADAEIREEYLKNWDSERVYDEEIRETLKERFSFVYPYEYLREIPVKVSVSELKKRKHVSFEDQETTAVYAERELVALVPKFAMEEEEHVVGAARGTAYHKVMECLNYEAVETREQLQEQVVKLVDQQKMLQTEADCIAISDVQKFVESPIGKRMKLAAQQKMLYREQPFVMSEKASLLDSRWNGNETVLVQGIIDAYFVEEDEIVLVDYKTDRIGRGQEQKLVDLYRVQLEDYAKALERMLKKRVKEAYIYSFTLGKEIRLF